MATSTVVWRIVAILVPAVLLLLFTYHGTLDFGNEVSQIILTDRPVDLEVVPTEQGDTNVPTSTDLPFGRHHHAVGFPSPLKHRLLFKRADPPPNYADWVCTGGALLEKIKASFEGSTPGISFSDKELENGWTKTTEVDEDEGKAIERRWKDTFNDLFGAYPPQSDIKPVLLNQDKEYDTILDKHIDRPTQAESQGIYYPKQQLAMSAVSNSAVRKILDRNKKDRLSKAERDALLPTISRLSDLMWLAWTTVAPKPERLRYLARDKINNDDTNTLMRYLFLRDKGQANSVVWPGLAYDGNSDEGKALLASPNGRATAWLLIDHGHLMDWRMKSRQLKVYIFAYAGVNCMLWDMEPETPRRQSKRDNNTDPQPRALD
ncbi:MAG: hypothetical protein Q9193_002266 [Seirophora villosa]